ncbi:hypothetical protein HK097_009442 [Rhizophlyctis rosea]|uniref:Uncharacterized protein n=1 Tax=Rhizophlyctis rosea TaxID=64517 RepID=A0AAD5S8Z2_9FUNG|nr:hypothetical protein HK097_009442 [Rhizophlyctis rosea]
MERRAHSDRVVALPPCDDDMDLMIEAKDKEMAVLDLYKRYGLSDKWRGVLTVPGEEGMRTKGRKRRKVVEEVEEVEEGGEEGDGKKRKARKKRGRKVVVVEEEEIVEPKGDECEECEHAVEEEDGSDFEPVGKEKLKAKGKGKGKPKAAAKPEPNGKVKVEETVVAVTTPKRKSRKVILSQTSEEPLPDEGDVLDAEIEAAGGRRKRRKVKIEVDDVEGEVGEDSVIPAPASTPAKKKRAKKVTSSGGESAGQDGSTADPVTNPAPKRVRKPKTIPPVDLPLELPSPREASPPAVTTPTSSSPPQKRARKQSEPQTIPFKRTKSSSTVNGTPPLTRRASKAASLGLSSEGLGGVVDQALKGVRIEG